MTRTTESDVGDDPYNLNRFLAAQEDMYQTVLAEIKSGRKRTHWMWFIFPQIDGLGFSEMSKRYSIKSAAEAKAYLAHPVLGQRLIECATATVDVRGRTAFQIFSSPDDMKLKSCATLFASVSAEGSVFHRLLDKYFQSQRDEKTLQLLDVE